MKKTDIEFIFSKIVAVLGVVIFAFILLMNITKTTYWHGGSVETFSDDRTNNVIGLAVLFVVFMALTFFESKFSKKVVLIIKCCIAAVFVAFCIYYIFCSESYSVADQALCYASAKALYEKNSNWVLISEDYLRANPHQFFLIEFYAIFFKLIRSCDVRYAQIFQCIAAVVGIFSLDNISKRVSAKKDGRLAGFMLLALFIPYWMYSFFMYGDIWGVSLVLLGLNLYFIADDYAETDKLKACIFGLPSILIMALAFNFRMLLFVFMIAITIIAVLKAIRHKNVMYLLIPILTIVLTFVIKSASLTYAQQYSEQNVSEGMPAISFIAMGMNEDNNACGGATGHYNGFNFSSYKESGWDKVAASDTAKEYMKEQYNQISSKPNGVAGFLYRKILHQWNITDCNIFDLTAYYTRGNAFIDFLYDSYNSLRLCFCLGLYQILCNALTLIYFLKILFDKKKEEGNSVYVMPGLILVGGFLATILWEASSRYTFPYVVLQCITAAEGLYICKNLVMRCADKIKKK